MKREEDTTQIQAVDWFRKQYPQRIICAIPNGYGKVKIWVAVIWKKLGLLSGMPDLLIPEPSGIYHGCFAETKSKKGVVSLAQKRIHEELESRGFYVFTYRTLEEFMYEVKEYLKYSLK